MTEDGYQEYVQRTLEEEYGAENVENSVYLASTYRFADFVVDAGWVTLAVEVEHSSEAAVMDGPGQARLYADHGSNWMPVVVYPPDGENEEELDMLRNRDGLLVKSLPHEHE